MGERTGERPPNSEPPLTQTPHRDRARLYITLGFAVAGAASVLASQTLERSQSDSALIGGILLLIVSAGGAHRLLRGS